MRPFLIDTDAGSDDAVALVMALRRSAVQIEAITVVAGNVPLESAVQNALYVCELCEREVPVHAGADRPLARAPGSSMRYTAKPHFYHSKADAVQAGR